MANIKYFCSIIRYFDLAVYGVLEKVVTKGVNWIEISPYLDGQDEGYAACKGVPISMLSENVKPVKATTF